MKKRVLKEKVEGWHGTIFKVRKGAGAKEEILVHFGHKVRYRVVKLDIRDLPARDRDGKKIKWINNFAVVDASGHFVKSVKYTVFLPAMRKNDRFIYFEKGRLKTNKTPKRKGSRWPRSGMVQVDFNTGDPGVGCH